MTDMIICGCSMEMDLMEELGWVGDCRGCLKFTNHVNGNMYCGYERIDVMETDCPDWIVDTR